MSPFYREFELLNPVINYFSDQGCKVLKEVRVGYCKADLVAFKDGIVTAIELKLHDRKKAIVQAKNYQFGADYVYLAFPLMNSYSLMRKSKHSLKKEGIGLLIVNEQTSDVIKIIKAKQSRRKIAAVTFSEIYRRMKNRT